MQARPLARGVLIRARGYARTPPLPHLQLLQLALQVLRARRRQALRRGVGLRVGAHVAGALGEHERVLGHSHVRLEAAHCGAQAIYEVEVRESMAGGGMLPIFALSLCKGTPSWPRPVLLSYRW